MFVATVEGVRGGWVKVFETESEAKDFIFEMMQRPSAHSPMIYVDNGDCED